VVVGKGIRSSEQPQKKNRTAFFVDKRETEKTDEEEKDNRNQTKDAGGVYVDGT